MKHRTALQIAREMAETEAREAQRAQEAIKTIAEKPENLTAELKNFVETEIFYINGTKASKSDIKRLLEDLKNGMQRATARTQNGITEITTKF